MSATWWTLPRERMAGGTVDTGGASARPPGAGESWLRARAARRYSARRMARAPAAIAAWRSIPALVRAHAWERTVLGPASDWPDSLESALGLCLDSAFPIAIYWGDDLALLYNDAWRPILGDKHPWALGRPASASPTASAIRRSRSCTGRRSIEAATNPWPTG